MNFSLFFFFSFPQTKIYAESVLDCGIKFRTPIFETKIGTNFDKYNFGLSLSTNNIFPKIPFQVKVGNLSAGGILSKMNQPLISGIGSPFSSGISSVSGINVSLPSYNSFSNPSSSFFQIGYNNKKNILQNIYLSCWYSQEEQIFSSSINTFFKFFNDKVRVKSAFCIGRFPYSENQSNSWMLKEPYYKEGVHFVTCFNNSLEILNLLLFLTLFSYEMPNGTIQNIYKAEFKYSGNHFLFTLSGAYNQTPIISSSDQKIKECIQFRSGLQYKETIHLKKLLFIKLGICTFVNFHQKENIQDFKSAVGLQLRNSIYSFSLIGQLNSKLDTENINYPVFTFESFNYKTEFNVFFPYVTTSLSLAALFNPDSNFEHLSSKYSGKIQASYGGKIKIIPSSGYSILIKDYDIQNQKIIFGLSFQYSYSFFTCSIKISTDMKF